MSGESTKTSGEIIISTGSSSKLFSGSISIVSGNTLGGQSSGKVALSMGNSLGTPGEISVSGGESKFEIGGSFKLSSGRGLLQSENIFIGSG